MAKLPHTIEVEVALTEETPGAVCTMCWDVPCSCVGGAVVPVGFALELIEALREKQAWTLHHLRGGVERMRELKYAKAIRQHEQRNSSD